MATSIVIKVQYGETLRRFRSQVVDEKLELDMNGLREKVCSLYSFPAGSELIFTYIDEDKDVVTLADEEDLNDIVRQSLNPLRISVKLIKKRSARSQSNSSENSTPVREPGVQTPLHVKSTSATEVLNSLPNSVSETASKLSSELGFDSKSPSRYADLPNMLGKMGFPYLKEGSVSGAKDGPSKSFSDATVTKDKTSSLAVGITQVSGKKNIGTKLDNSSGFSENFVVEATDSFNATGSRKQDFRENVVMEATDMEIVKDEPSTLSAKTNLDSSNVTAGRKQDRDNTGSSEGNKARNNARSVQKMKAKSIESRQWWNYVMGSQPSNNAQTSHKIETKKLIEPRQGKDGEARSGIDSSFATFQSVNKRQHPHHNVPSGRSYNTIDGISSVFHSGVRCDGCGVHPISGPRFKSKVKDDYDLCSICFVDIGTEAEYIRMDHPMCYKDSMQQYCLGRPPTPADHSKLDSCFIQDVNILDGTVMTPSTQFTKIWRMRNNGGVVWPHGTRLVWIGGNMFSKTLSCYIKIPAEGCPVDKEIDIAVGFTAPEHPGRYVSYWRMCTPAGLKFGQRVWVLIQVNSSLKDPLGKNVHGFNWNWPPISGAGIMDYSDEISPGYPMHQDSLLDIGNYGNFSKTIKKQVPNIPKWGQGLNLPTDITPLVAGAEPNPELLKASLPVKSPVANPSKVEQAAVSVPQNSELGIPSSMVGVGQGKDVIEQIILHDLEELGFKQVDLNKKILRKNDYDFEQTLNDLFMWDPYGLEEF